MNGRPLFQLSPRLAACARLVPQGAKLADIGTDHAYLPVWLARRGRIAHALACDLREGPLQRAEENILKYRVQGIVETRLSDGLSALSPQEADTIVIAGMGGDLMVQILTRAPWLKDGKTLILQCMTSAEELRRWLLAEGYRVEQEKAVRSEGRVYTVMLVRWQTGNWEVDPLFPFIGLLEYGDGAEARDYILREIRHLENCLKGRRARGEDKTAEELEEIIRQLRPLTKEETT